MVVVLMSTVVLDFCASLKQTVETLSLPELLNKDSFASCDPTAPVCGMF